MTCDRTHGLSGGPSRIEREPQNAPQSPRIPRRGAMVERRAGVRAARPDDHVCTWIQLDESLLCNAVLATDRASVPRCLGFLQNPNDLLFTETHLGVHAGEHVCIYDSGTRSGRR